MTNTKDTLATLSEAAQDAYEAAMEAVDQRHPVKAIEALRSKNAAAHDALAHALVNAYRTGRLVPVPSVEGWIVGNGAGTKWRTWKDGWSSWTDDPNEATRYARREDAEAVHYHDEDAWTVQPATAVIALHSDCDEG